METCFNMPQSNVVVRGSKIFVFGYDEPTMDPANPYVLCHLSPDTQDYARKRQRKMASSWLIMNNYLLAVDAVLFHSTLAIAIFNKRCFTG